MSSVSRNSVVVGQTPPDMTLDEFAKVLIEGSALSADDINKGYQAIKTTGVSPAFALAIFCKESGFGKAGFAPVNKNPGNTRTSTTGIGIPVTTVKGVFIRYPSWYEGFRDMVWRLVKPDYVYALEGRKTIEQIIERWAPPTENDTEGYIASVVTNMNIWMGGKGAMPDPTNKIDIVHANKGRDGANPEIIVLHVQEGTNYLPDFFRQSGDDSTMWCMQDGTLIRMEQDSDSAWTNGLMTEPLDHSNPHIQSLVNRGITNSNIYALTIEHQGFASGQFTDAAIEATAKMCAYWMTKYGWSDVDTRIVSHAAIGQHKNCPGPNFPWAKLKARVKDLIGGATVLTTDNHTPLPQPTTLPYGVTVDSAGALIFPGNIPLNFGFKDAYLTLFGNVPAGDDLGAAVIRGAKVFGLPTGPEVADQTGSTQEFELSTFRYNKNEAEGWQIRLFKRAVTA